MLKLWDNDVDLVVAHTAEEARNLCADHHGEEIEDVSPFEEWAAPIIHWHTKCGAGEGVEYTPERLVAHLGHGYAGSTEC